MLPKFRGIILGTKGCEQTSSSILPFTKKIQQYKKGIKKMVLLYQKVLIQPLSSKFTQLSSLNKSISQQMKTITNKSQYYNSFIDIFIDVEMIQKSYIRECKDYLQERNNAIQEQCEKLNQIVFKLHQKLNLHQINQNQANQEFKRYYKHFKNLMNSIQSYKNAYKDAKLIYNMQQKVKRYKNCFDIYSNILNEFQRLQQRIELITLVRKQTKSILIQFRLKSLQFIKVVTNQMIKLPANVVKCLIRSNKQVSKVLCIKSKELSQKHLKTLFQKFRLPFPYPQYFTNQIKQTEQYYPTFMIHINDLKDEHFGKSKKMLLQYFRSMLVDIQQRQNMIEKIKYYLHGLINMFEKIYLNQYKQAKDIYTDKNLRYIKANFSQKDIKQSDLLKKTDITKQSDLSKKTDIPKQNLMKQPAQQHTNIKKQQLNQSNPLQQTIQKILQLLQQQKQQSQKFLKQSTPHIKSIIFELDQQLKQILIFRKEFKFNCYKLFQGEKNSIDSKKEFKHDLDRIQNGQDLNLDFNRQQLQKKVQFLILLVDGFRNKFQHHAHKIKVKTTQFFQDYIKNLTLQKNVLEKYWDRLRVIILQMIEQFQSSNEEENSNQSNIWVDQNKLYQIMVLENVQINFDSQIQSAHELKNLKKPSQQNQSALKNVQIAQDNDSNTVEIVETQDENIVQVSQSKQQSPSNRSLNPFKFFKKNDSQFIEKNITMAKDQKLIDSFSCGLADKIIVSGRLYITTNKLFFHSYFNSSNIFFGGTKLEIPKFHIKKIQKRYNAIVFDNSISITTVNGQIFFTSFTSRDKAYDIICQTFQIYPQGLTQESEDSQEQIQIYAKDQSNTQQIKQQVEQVSVIQQDDDLKEQDVPERQRIIMEIIQKIQQQDQKVQYKNLLNYQLNYPGLNPVKFFKIFDSGQQVSYQSKNYQSFWHYFKCQVHKNQSTQISGWQPNIMDYLNLSNIKQSTPVSKFTRKSQTKVPTPPSNIPFMPKFIQSAEKFQLYFVSKDKYILTFIVNNSKAPYTDCFYLRGKKVVEKVAQNTITVKNYLKIVFTKNAMVKKIIQSKTYEQGLLNQKSLQQQTHKYLKYLQKKASKSKRLLKVAKSQQKLEQIKQNQPQQTNKDQQVDENEQLQQLSKTIKDLKSENNQLKTKLNTTQKKNSFLMINLGISLLIHIIFCFMLLGGQDGSISNEN